MNRKLYWIDDSHDNQRLPRTSIKRQLEKGLGVILYPQMTLSDRGAFTALLAEMEHDHPVGVIMDYQLTELGDRGQTAYGTTWAAEIRATHPSTPVIGISHCAEKDIPKFRLESFLAFFSRSALTGIHPQIKNLKALLDGYHQTYKAFESRGSKTGVALMSDLLAPPKGISDLIHSAIPLALRGDWDAETPHTAGRWIWHEFQGRPGFLFDELEVATHLGLNINGFNKIYKKFVSARYRGVFASDERPRWWVSSIRPLSEQIVGEGIIGSISGIRDILLKVARIKSDERPSLLARPHPHKISNLVPNCVAYRDEDREREHRVQAMAEQTYVDDRDANPPFGFEARRIFGSGKTE